MLTLFGILVLHVLVIMRAKLSTGENVPYFSTAFFSLILTGFVLFMMFEMEQPIP
ncbi:MAG: hypothetical protein WD016_07475 [Balneolaceae bacterium]